MPEYSESDMGKISLEEAVETVKTLSDSVAGLRGRKTSLEEQREKLKASLRRIEPFMAFQFNVHKLLGFKFIKYRFGKIAHEYYEKLEKYVYEDLDSVFFKCNTDEQYVWGIYLYLLHRRMRLTRYTPPCILNRCIFQMNMKVHQRKRLRSSIKRLMNMTERSKSASRRSGTASRPPWISF